MIIAKGIIKIPTMNKLEASYGQRLQLLERAGEVIWYRFEGIKLRLADEAFFMVDYFVMNKDRTLECHEVKGFWREAAKVRIKVASELYPFRFVVVSVKKNAWVCEEF